MTNNVILHTEKLETIFGINSGTESSKIVSLNSPLKIPDYQRAYEWDSDHIRNLLKDTYEAFSKDKPYLMGTLILHDNGNEHEIIDGQQRLITLSILLYCLNKDKSTALLTDAKFDNTKSIFYIKNAQFVIDSFLGDKNLDQKNSYYDFLLSKLIFSVLIVAGNNALDHAYTFFDSFNSKGKGLTDFDLLKAHHLMFIPEKQESLACRHNEFWSNIDGEDKDKGHHLLFSHILRRIRMWSRAKDRDNKSDRNNFYEFISVVEPDQIDQHEHCFNRYMQPNVFSSWYRESDEVVLNMKYPQRCAEELLPVEIPQTIEGGDAFFIYAKRYHDMFKLLFGETSKRTSEMEYVYGLSLVITNGYLSTAFKAAMLLYYDKFGECLLIEAATCVELLISDIRFKWGNTRPSPVRVETMLSRVYNANIIPIILNSTRPSHAISLLSEQISVSKFSCVNTNNNNKESSTLKTYKDNVSDFYRSSSSKVKNSKLVEKLNFIYSIKNI